MLPGADPVEYKRRHDAIWPELADLLKASGVSDYSIYLDEQHDVLFAVLHLADGHTMLVNWRSVRTIQIRTGPAAADPGTTPFGDPPIP